MGLTELQVQLRSIEEQISALQQEIEKMKPCPNDDQKKILENITKMAAEYPLKNRFASNISAIEIKGYLSCLAYIVLAEEKLIYDRLLFLNRLSFGMGLSITSEEIYQMGLEVDRSFFDMMVSESKGYKYSLLADALILVNMQEEASNTALGLIADMAVLCGCDKKELNVIAAVAKANLTEDYSSLSQLSIVNTNRWSGHFRGLISEEWLISNRIKCGRICIEMEGNMMESASNMTYCSVPKRPWNRMRIEREEELLRKAMKEEVLKATQEKHHCSIKKRTWTGSIVKKGDILISGMNPERKLTSEVKFSLKYTKHTEEEIEDIINDKSSYEITMENIEIKAPHDGIVFFVESQGSSEAIGCQDRYLDVYVVSYFDEYADFCEWHKNK